MAALVKLSRPFRQTTCCVCSMLPGVRNERHNSNRASLTRTKKLHYIRTYPTFLVQPDGSTISIRYEKPRKLLTLPVDVTKLTEQEIQARIRKFNPPQKTEVKEEIEDNFDVNIYTNMLKKKKNQ